VGSDNDELLLETVFQRLTEFAPPFFVQGFNHAFVADQVITNELLTFLPQPAHRPRVYAVIPPNRSTSSSRKSVKSFCSKGPPPVLL